MNKLIPLVLVLLYGCSPKISEHFEQNRYIKNYSIHVINDSLSMYFYSPADFTFTTDRKELKRIIRKEKIKDSVLFYGETNMPPYYAYFVTVSENPKIEYSKNYVVFDTIINNKTIQFIGKPLAKNAKKTLEIDLNNIFKSLEVGSGYRKEISTVMDVVQRYQKSNKFFLALNEIRKYPTYDKQEEWTKLQMELTFSSFLGNNTYYQAYLNQLESRFTPNDTLSTILKENSKTENEAIETILNEAKTHKIVMINENHYYPNHRLLVTDLLVKLKEQGYRYFALEALDIQQDSVLNLAGSFPTTETGFYTSEQHYGNLIRKAKELGYIFVSYENMDNTKDREVAQAENIYNKTFKIDPKSKVLVLAGIDHILEKPTSSGKKWMATVFKEKYGIDPLTISQTHLNSYRKQSEAEYSIISREFFKNERLNSVDYLALNNKTEPDALSTFSYKTNTKQEVQVALFYSNEIPYPNEYHNKIPYFTTLLNSGKKYELPRYKTGQIQLYAFDKNGKIVDKQTID